MRIYPEILVSGTHMIDFWYRIEYDEELALAGLPPYYVHRSRYQRDGLRNPRQVFTATFTRAEGSTWWHAK